MENLWENNGTLEPSLAPMVQLEVNRITTNQGWNSVINFHELWHEEFWSWALWSCSLSTSWSAMSQHWALQLLYPRPLLSSLIHFKVSPKLAWKWLFSLWVCVKRWYHNSGSQLANALVFTLWPNSLIIVRHSSLKSSNDSPMFV